MRQGVFCDFCDGSAAGGKTTMLGELVERERIGRAYVTLDDLNTRDMAKNDPVLFLKMHRPSIIIDEVQNAPELFTYIKIHIDENHMPGAFWLTGSQIFRLIRGVQESLAGRIALLHMSPMSWQEITGSERGPFHWILKPFFSIAKRLHPLRLLNYSNACGRGVSGIVGGQFSDRDIFYSSYISTYVERDMRELSGTIDALKFN